VFSYDYNDEVNAVLLNVPNPDTTPAGPQTIFYDTNGNRTTFQPYQTTDTYTTNYLNQYSQRNATLADYNWNGDMRTGLDASTYTYDAQNRLLTAAKNGVTDTFTYDGLNRQVSRQVGTGSPIYYNVYDGWDLIGEYHAGGAVTVSYFHGASGLVRNIGTGGINHYYYQDASGSTSHLADSTGHLLEWYRYDLQGTPVFYNASNTQISASAYGVRHLFTGQQWYSELGLYDLRNRYYSPDIGRFLQADPIGFGGDATNLYRYCGNNPLKRSDPSGLSGTIVINTTNPSAGEPGHAWITFISDDTGAWTTMGLWPSNIIAGGLQSNYKYYGDVWRSAWIDDDAEARMNSAGGDVWLGPAYNCADYAASKWQAATGEQLNADIFGMAHVPVLGISVIAQNGGSDYGYKDSSSDGGDSSLNFLYQDASSAADFSGTSGTTSDFVSAIGEILGTVPADAGGGWWGSGGTTTYYPQQIGFDVLPGGSVGGFSPGFTATDPVDFGAMDYINARRAARGKPPLYPHGGDLRVIPHG